MEIPQKLRKGKWVNVYEDPRTCKKIEGVAVLLKRCKPRSTREGMEQWDVEFRPHESGDPIIARWINKDNH